MSVTLPDPEPVDVAPQDIPLDVVYEDGDVIVVNKPKGLVVHPAPGHPDGTLVNALLLPLRRVPLRHRRGAAARASSTGSTGTPPASSSRRKTTSPTRSSGRPAAGPHPGPDLRVHRDRATSGRTAARWTPPSAATRRTGRRWRWSGGRPERRDPLVRAGAVPAAIPMWSAVWRPGAPTRSGSTWPHIGHPILGDTVYGGKKPVPGLQGQCLHAVGLQFRPSPDRGAGGAGVPPAGGVCRQLGKLENRG